MPRRLDAAPAGLTVRQRAPSFGDVRPSGFSLLRRTRSKRAGHWHGRVDGARLGRSGDERSLETTFSQRTIASPAVPSHVNVFAVERRASAPKREPSHLRRSLFHGSGQRCASLPEAAQQFKPLRRNSPPHRSGPRNGKATSFCGCLGTPSPPAPQDRAPGLANIRNQPPAAAILG